MPRDITVTFADGSQHVYQNAPDDVTPEQVQARATEEFKKPITGLDGGRPAAPADTRRPEDVGFFEGIGAATKKGFEGLGDIASGLGLAGTSLFGSKEDTAKKMAAIKADQEAQSKETPTLTAADIQRIAEERGLVKAGAQVPAYIAEQILQSAPQMALPLAAGAAASPFLTPIGGALVGMGVYGVQQFGNFLVRQAQAKKDPEELEIAKAALTAAGTAPIGYMVDRWTAGIGSLGSKEAGKQIFKELSARQAAGEIGKRAAKGAGVGIISEAPTEVLEQAAERWQAGLALDDAEAMREYKEAFFGAAAAGAGIGGGSRAISGYGDLRQARAEEKALGEARSEKNAFTEAAEGEEGGIDRGINQQGVSVLDEQGAAGTAGAGVAGPGDLEGTQLPTGAAGNREAAINNQLNALRQQQAEIAAFDPNDPRIGEIEEVIKELQADVRTFNAPTQQGFDFTQADETTQRALEPEKMTETSGFALKQEAGALPTGDVAKIEEAAAAPKAKMMLVGTGANPLAPVESLLNSVKPASQNPQQQVQYKNEVKNFLEDMLEFIGQSRKKVERYKEEGAPSRGEGPDVSVPLTGPQREMRLNFLDKFFDKLSDAPVDKENLTSTLSQRFPGMSLAAQQKALESLTNVPGLNTLRGLKELRAKFNEELAAFEGELMGQPVEEAALPYQPYDKYTPSGRVSEVLRQLDQAKDVDEQSKAASNYFGRWNFITGMRSAAFDLATLSTDEAGIFKGQNKKQAEMFRNWVEENMPAEQLAKFDATVAEFSKQLKKADALQKQADEAQKLAREGGLSRKYAQGIARAPSGKESGVFKEKAGLGKAMKPSQAVPYDFRPMHPAVEQALREGNLDAALAILSTSGSTFQAGIAKRMRQLGLQTSVVFGRQRVMAGQLIDLTADQARTTVFEHFKEVNPALYDEFFTNPQEFEKVAGALDALLADPKFKEQVAPVIGELNQVAEAYRKAVHMQGVPGTYANTFDTVNLNPDMGGTTNAVFLHELVHAATVYSLSKRNYNELNATQKAAVDEINNLYEFAKRTGLEEYGFENVEEFVAEAFTNETFQGLLKSLPYTPKKNISFWDRFTSLIAKLFGMDNVLGYTLANANAIFQAPPAMTKDAVMFNAPPKRTVLAGTKPTNPGFLKEGVSKVFNGRPEWNMVKTRMAQFIENMQDTSRKYYLQGFTLRQLGDMIGHRIPQFKTFIDKVEALADMRNRMQQKTHKIAKRWAKWQKANPEQAKTLNKLMIDVTLDDRTDYIDANGKVYRFNKDPDLGTTGIKETDAAWNKLDDEGKAIYREVRDYYRDSMKDYIDNIVEHKKSQFRTTLDESDPKYAQETKDLEAEPEVQEVRKYFAKHKVDVYFPIRRFGRYSVQFLKGADKEFYMFESASARNKFMEKRRAELEQERGGPLSDEDVKPHNTVQSLSSENMQSFQFLQDLKDIIAGGKSADTGALKTELTDALEQLYFLHLPDKSVRKMFMNRKGVAGMDEDMLRAFTASTFHMSYQHSRYKYSRGLYADVDTARKDAIAKGGTEGKVEREYVEELNNRLNAIMNPPDTGEIAGFLSNVSFIWYMTAPASAVVNMLGVPAIGLPVMGARFGLSKSASKLTSMAAKFTQTGFKDKDGNPAFPSLNNKDGILTPLQQRAYDELVTDGLFDITQSHDLVNMAESPSMSYNDKMHKGMQWLSGAFHGAEKFNREVVGMSAFDLAYEQAIAEKYSPEAAFKKAIAAAKKVTYDSMFDYSTLNKPRILQNQISKVLFQFKQFPQQMTYLLARSTYEWIGKDYSPEERLDIRNAIRADHNVNKPGEPPLTDAELDAAVEKHIKEVKRQARDRLGGTLGMTALFAGATGMPLFSVVAGIMNALGAAFGDDEEEYDFANWFKNWCHNTFGGFVGDSISRGLFTQVTGMDLSSRMGLNDLWFRDGRQSADEVANFNALLVSLLGPTASLGVTMFGEVPKLINDGHLDRAVETASPAILKNALKSYRIAEEGRVTNLKGNEIVGDVTGYESLGQLIGFNPERISQAQKANIETKTMEQKILSRKAALSDAFFMSVDNHDAELKARVLEKMRAFNRAHPGKAFTADDLEKSVETRYKQRALARVTGGMNIDKKLIAELRHMQEYRSED